MKGKTLSPPIHSMNNDKLIGKQHIRRVLSAAILTLFTSSSLTLSEPLPVFAQIPTMDEYYAGSGTKIKSVGTGGPVATYTPIINTEKQSDETVSTLRMIEVLEKAKELSANNYWENVMLELKCFTNTGKNSDNVVTRRLQEKPEKYEELKFLVGQVIDTARSSRVVFFNKDDKEQVQGMVEMNKDDADDEREDVKTLLDEAIKILKDNYN